MTTAFDDNYGRDFISRINQYKTDLANDNSLLVDGSLASNGPFDNLSDTIADANKASRGWKDLEFLHVLTILHKPHTIVELGTNIGMSTAYLAAAQKACNIDGVLHTIDASPYRINVAKKMHANLELNNISYTTGLFFDVLPDVLHQAQKVDMTFIDGQYAKNPTLYFFEEVSKFSSNGALIVFGGIQFSEEMQNTWKLIRKSHQVLAASEVGGLGMIILA